MKNSLNANHKKWYVIDAKGKTLGKLATIIATILNGKHKSINNPSLDCGDYVIIINAGKVQITGNKNDDKTYYRHTGYPGGIRSITAGIGIRRDRKIRT